VSLIGLVALALTALIQPQAGGVARAKDGTQGNLFVKRAGPILKVHGQQFRFAGTNNYYLMYKSRAMVDDVLDSAAANNFKVVRTWGWLDIGNEDGSNSVAGKADGVYFQYWDGTKPAYNDGPDGLQRLDYVVAKAKSLGLRLVIPLTNNWADFGGMDQYVRWRGGQYHDQFYTDPVIRGWYKSWITHVLNRTNTITGLQYKNDPTIMTWELGNEPRCVGSGVYPRSSSCTTQTLTAWADEMSTFIKSVDDRHLVSVGDEGFYCVPNAADWIDNCGDGVDTIALTSLPNIDIMSFHLYPDGWGNRTAQWGKEWIERHVRDAKALGKPVMMGEFGWRDKNTRNPVYKEWTDAFFKSGGKSGGDGALYWILSGKQDDGSLYGDYDGFTVYAGDPLFITLGNFAQMMNVNHSLTFAPVADNDAVTTEFETPVTLTPAANDIAYGGATLPVSTIDLDPAAAGRQTSRSVAGGVFTLNGATVTFTPAAGFAGRATISYTIRDSSARTSNVASLIVSVKPDPNGAITLFSFETGSEGWGPASWETGKGAAAQTSAFQTKDSSGLEITVVNEGWFGVTFSPPAELPGKTRLKLDIKAGGGGTSTDVAIQTGDSYTWTQYPGTWVNSGGTATIDIDLLSQSPDLSKVQALYIYLKPGTHYIDFVRAE
jgi:mannan endo-1,4-beta-mannosidase